MATGTFYLRPSADISLGHPVYPDTLEAGYLAISEEVSDGTATYIGAYDPDNAVEYASSFRMSLVDGAEIKSVLSAKLGFAGSCFRAGSNSYNRAECDCSVFVSGESVFTGSYVSRNNAEGTQVIEDGLTNADMPDLVTAINGFLSSSGSAVLPDVTIDISNSINATDGKNTATSYVTQIYIELECEYASGFNIHRKASGSWAQVQAAYQKRDGAWVEITEDECRAILQGNKLN